MQITGLSVIDFSRLHWSLVEHFSVRARTAPWYTDAKSDLARDNRLATARCHSTGDMSRPPRGKMVAETKIGARRVRVKGKSAGTTGR